MKDYKNNMTKTYKSYGEEIFNTMFKKGNIVEYNPLTFDDSKPFIPLFLFRIDWDSVTNEVKDEGVHIMPSVWIQEYELIKEVN